MIDISFGILERIAKRRGVKVYIILDEIIEDELRRLRDREKLTNINKK